MNYQQHLSKTQTKPTHFDCHNPVSLRTFMPKVKDTMLMFPFLASIIEDSIGGDAFFHMHTLVIPSRAI